MTDPVYARVSVIIPNWNGAHLLAPCLESLRRQSFRDFVVTVVDNGSTDESLASLETRFPEVNTIALPSNIGFVGAVNTGIRCTTGEYVVLLNNDTEAPDDWLERLVEAMATSPQYGFGASKLLDFSRRDLIDRVGDAFSPFGVPLRIGGNTPDDGRFDIPFETFGACAAASIYRRVLLEEIGLLHKDYFAYVEDVDLSMRAQLAGHRCLAVTDARVFHHGSASSGGVASPFSIRLTVRNLWRTMFRCLPWPLLISTMTRAIFVQAGAAVAGLVLDKGPLRRHLLPAYFRGLFDAIGTIPASVRERRSICRRVSGAIFHRQMMLGYQQWRRYRN